jgi:hypothetical protein
MSIPRGAQVIILTRQKEFTKVVEANAVAEEMSYRFERPESIIDIDEVEIS